MKRIVKLIYTENGRNEFYFYNSSSTPFLSVSNCYGSPISSFSHANCELSCDSNLLIATPACRRFWRWRRTRTRTLVNVLRMVGCVYGKYVTYVYLTPGAIKLLNVDHTHYIALPFVLFCYLSPDCETPPTTHSVVLCSLASSCDLACVYSRRVPDKR